MKEIEIIFTFILIGIFFTSIQCLYLKKFYLSKNNLQTKYPVILVPGYGGNQIYAKLNKSTAANRLCKKKTNEFFKLWLNVFDVTFNIDCMVENLKLVYKNETKFTYNNDGVEILIKDFGKTSSLEYFDSPKVGFSSYYATIVNALVKKANYVRNVNIRGAPYDWRRSPDELHPYYLSLTRLIEETYEMNNQTKVMIVAHSMGNPVTVYWLNNYVDYAWKQKYIRFLVSMSAPWGGAAKIVRDIVSGENFNEFFINPLSLRPYLRSATSSAFLLPSYNYWSGDEIIVTTPKRKYTVFDYEELFNDISFPQGYELFKKSNHLLNNLNAPNVEIHSLYGVGVKTPENFEYDELENWYDKQPFINFGDGDGTVNKKSLIGFERWILKQNEKIYSRELQGVDHLQILKNKYTTEYILDLLYL